MTSIENCQFAAPPRYADEFTRLGSDVFLQEYLQLRNFMPETLQLCIPLLTSDEHSGFEGCPEFVLMMRRPFLSPGCVWRGVVVCDGTNVLFTRCSIGGCDIIIDHQSIKVLIEIDGIAIK